METPFSLGQARGDEPQREQRLADPGGADEERRVASGDPSADRVVELLEPERRARSRGSGRAGQRCLEAREDLEAAAADPEAVLAGRDLGTAHLQDAQPPPVDRPARFVLELEDPVGDANSGRSVSPTRSIRRP